MIVIVLFDAMQEMLEVIFREVFYSEVINTQYDLCSPCSIFPQAGGSGNRVIPLFRDICLKLLVGQDGRLFQPINPFLDANIHEAVYHKFF